MRHQGPRAEALARPHHSGAGFIDGANRLERDETATDVLSRVPGWYIENFRTEAQVLSADADVASHAPPSRSGA